MRSMSKRLNIDVTEDFHRECRVFVAQNGITLTSLVETAVRELMVRGLNVEQKGASGSSSLQGPSAVPSSLEPDSEGGSRARAFPTRAAS